MSGYPGDERSAAEQSEYTATYLKLKALAEGDGDIIFDGLAFEDPRCDACRLDASAFITFEWSALVLCCSCATKEKAEREASAVAKERARVEGLSPKGSVARARGQIVSIDAARNEGHEVPGALESCVRALVDAVEALAHREDAAASSVPRGTPEPVVHVPDGETAPTITLTAERLDQLQKSCEATYGGGHHGEKLEAFQHGMWTAFNVLRSSIGAKTPSIPSVPRGAAITDVAAALAAEEAAKADEVLGPVAIVPHPEPLATVGLSAPQPSPKPTGGAAIWDLVIADMKERDRVGRERYGTPLQAGNGRDAIVDAYQEALDLAVYLRQAIEERDGRGASHSEAGLSHREMVEALSAAGWTRCGGGWMNQDCSHVVYGSTEEAYDRIMGPPSDQEMAAALLASGWYVRREAGIRPMVERWTDRTGKVSPLPLAEAYAAMLAEKAR